MGNTPKQASSTLFKLAALTTSIALLGTYVGWRVLRADARTPAAPTPPPASPTPGQSLTPEDGTFLHMGGSKSEAVIRVVEPEELIHLAGSKSMIGVVEPRDVEPKVIVPPKPAPPAPDAPRK